MLFNSYPFIFLFLPVTLLGYFLLGKIRGLAPILWLALASLVFYSVSNWQFVPLLLVSVAVNYAIGSLLIQKRPRAVPRFAVLTIGVVGDLLVLGYFKYAGFFANNLNAVFSTGLMLPSTSCFRSGFHSTRLPRLLSWWMRFADKSHVTGCLITRCSSPTSRI